jgi:hypothetical protein
MIQREGLSVFSVNLKSNIKNSKKEGKDQKNHQVLIYRVKPLTFNVKGGEDEI